MIGAIVSVCTGLAAGAAAAFAAVASPDDLVPRALFFAGSWTAGAVALRLPEDLMTATVVCDSEATTVDPSAATTVALRVAERVTLRIPLMLEMSACCACA